MYITHVFGASTPTGISLKKEVHLNKLSDNFYFYSRNGKNNRFVDLNESSSFIPAEFNTPSIWLSFAPCWLFSKFMFEIYDKSPNFLKEVKLLVVCTSTSLLTKKYASNEYDKSLIDKLKKAESNLVELSNKLNCSLRIIRPTLIYGNIGENKDKNISQILSIMRKTPFLIIPKRTGLRQPIHFSQLSMVSFFLIKNFTKNPSKYRTIESLNIGGDEELRFSEILERLKKFSQKKDKAKNCKIFFIPNSLFYRLILIVGFFSPKYFEMMNRLTVDMSGFKQVSKIMKLPISSFPLKK